MPGQSAHDVLVRDGERNLTSRLEGPLCVTLLFGCRSRFDFVSLLCDADSGLGPLVDCACREFRGDQVDLFLVSDSQEAVSCVWTPLNAVNHLVWKFVFPYNLGCLRVPDHEVVILVSRGQEHSIWGDCDGSYCGRVEVEVNRYLSRERLQVIW